MSPDLNDIKQRLEALEAEFYRNNFTASQDFNKASRFTTKLRVPTGTTLPATCEIGDLFVDTDDGKLRVCSSANTWTICGTQTA